MGLNSEIKLLMDEGYITKGIDRKKLKGIRAFRILNSICPHFRAKLKCLK